MDDRYYVETPEIVDLAFDVAGIGSRCLAASVDTLLIIALQIGAALLLFGGAGRLLGASAEGSSLVLAVWAIISFGLLWGYYLLFELIWNGQSPGKRLFGLRTVREGGRPIGAVAAIIRNLVRIVDFLPLFYGLGVLIMFVDRRARRLGDLAAGTLVVREANSLNLAGLTANALPLPLPPRAPDAPPTPLLPNLHLLAPENYELAEEFLRRRAALSSSARIHLAARLAATLRTQLGLQQDGDTERFIEHVVREYRVYVSMKNEKC